ncbi:Metallo-dependent phosphatase-like protein [Mucor mucedo]|uniref:Metallo-dependent phosphatase-like protein n=1 Tax=Mucor mucedo TaxID=29922 RepID=UPI0022208A6C|nr:Metallo-dependent phosphatase-like protein [Mucor mucedo]KAI7890591.1 Metallo-dependent phosphatase-like protein [Mucor mucedo]
MSEPQQLHISLTDDATHARVQFATLGKIQDSVLAYWPKREYRNYHHRSNRASKNKIFLKGENWVFTDGGLAKRELYLHKFKTHALIPATIYAYQVGSVMDNRIRWSKTYEFHTAPETNEFSFLATGDVGACNAVAVSHLIELGKTHKYDFVTLAGDQAYNMEDFNGTKGDEYMNFMQDLYAQVPYLGAVGNHEGAYNFTHYKNRFNIVPYTESKFDNSMFYSINYKSLHLVSFSTEVYFTGSTAEIRTALNWLEADLTKANKNREERPWIIFLTHHPIYCSVVSADCTTKASIIRDGVIGANNRTWGGLEDILLKHKVDIYMSGHVHNYERTYPVSKNKRIATSYHNSPSFFQIVIGNAGQPEGATPFGPGPYNDWSAKRYGSYGFSTFDVSRTAIHITHYQAHTDGSLGDVIDKFSVTKDPYRIKSKRNCKA